MPTSAEFPTRWYHVKRGTQYTVICIAALQTDTKGLLVDNQPMVTYMSLDPECPPKYLYCTRSLEEFTDGRFRQGVPDVF